MAEELQNTVHSDDIRRAWEYHKEADQLLHSRISSLLIAEAFLVISAVSIAVTQYRDYALLSYLLFIVSLLGISITHWLKLANRSITKRIGFLKENYLIHDTVYKQYLEVAGGFKRGILTGLIPNAFLCFWLAILPVCIYFAVKALEIM